MIGDDSVHLFWHLSVEGSKSRLDMCNGYVQLRGGERTGQSRVCVSIDKREIGANLKHHTLDLTEHTACLFPMGARTNLEVKVGNWYIELLEEHIGHVFVIVLSCMEEDLTKSSARAKLMRHCSGLHELRACTNYRKNRFHL